MRVDARLQQLAERSANFGFLLSVEPVLLSNGAAAYDDPNTVLVKARQFGEAAADSLIARMGLRNGQATCCSAWHANGFGGGERNLVRQTVPGLWR
ncbi:hypothetical protein GCM10009609_59820 [Pseudonocardia aurantiaca]|uniref:Uncharacterized protein n=1 Tax=Pseudonocardia aurantiaca TaxID=75290 RepID=A0ABW4FUL5_9PSEU